MVRTHVIPERLRASGRRSRVIGGVAIGALILGSMAFALAPTAGAAGSDTGTGSAFGVSLSGLIPIAGIPSVTLPATGTPSQNMTTIPLPVSPVLTSGTLNAVTCSPTALQVPTTASPLPCTPAPTATNYSNANELIQSGAGAEGLNVAPTGVPLTAVISAAAVFSNCASSATGSTAGALVANLSIGGTPINIPDPVPANDMVTPAALSAVLSVELNKQSSTGSTTGPTNVLHSTNVTDDALVITVLGATGETVTVGQSVCSAAGPDIDAPPTVTGVNPSSGPTAGGTSVTIAGTGFACVSGVSFGGTPATTFTVTSPTDITAVSPAGAAGPVDVTVTNCFGTSPTGTADTFTYVAPVGNGSGNTAPAAGTAPITPPVDVTG
jgi:hypothetical protein